MKTPKRLVGVELRGAAAEHEIAGRRCARVGELGQQARLADAALAGHLQQSRVGGLEPRPQEALDLSQLARTPARSARRVGRRPAGGDG